MFDANEEYTVGLTLCRARRELVKRYRLLRMRAAVPLRGYRRFSDELSPVDYVEKVMKGKLEDPALSFQLRWGVKVMAILRGHLERDTQSLGWSALIGWRNADWSPHHVRIIRATRGPDFAPDFGSRRDARH
jgi:hypothetical protein